MRFFFLLSGLSLWPWAMFAQMSTEAPVEDFAMPVFDKGGNLVWEVAGKKAWFRDDGLLQIEQLAIQWFASGEQEGITYVQSPEAIVSIENGSAQGDTSLQVQRDDFLLTGSDWVFHSQQQTLSLKSNVEMRINAVFFNFLQ